MKHIEFFANNNSLDRLVYWRRISSDSKVVCDLISKYLEDNRYEHMFSVLNSQSSIVSEKTTCINVLDLFFAQYADAINDIGKYAEKLYTKHRKLLTALAIMLPRNSYDSTSTFRKIQINQIRTRIIEKISEYSVNCVDFWIVYLVLLVSIKKFLYFLMHINSGMWKAYHSEPFGLKRNNTFLKVVKSKEFFKEIQTCASESTLLTQKNIEFLKVIIHGKEIHKNLDTLLDLKKVT